MLKNKSWAKELQKFKNNQNINHTHHLLENLSCFNNIFAYFKLRVNDLDANSNRCVTLSIKNREKIIKFDKELRKCIEPIAEKMRSLLDVTNSNSISEEFRKNIKTLIKTTTNLLEKMNIETNSLVSFSNEHKITRKNYNLLKTKLNNLIKKLNSLLENKNVSVLKFAQEIIKVQMALINYYSSDIFYIHKIQRQIEKQLDIEQSEFPIPTFFKTPGKPVALQVMALKTNRIDFIEKNPLLTNITNKPFPNLPAIITKAGDLTFWITISTAGIIAAVSGYVIYKILKWRWDDNKKLMLIVPQILTLKIQQLDRYYEFKSNFSIKLWKNNSSLLLYKIKHYFYIKSIFFNKY